MAVPQIAKKAGWIDRFKCRKLLKRTQSISTRYDFKYLDNYFDYFINEVNRQLSASQNVEQP